MPDLLEDVDLLHHFLLRVHILHVTLVDGLDSNLPASQLVNSECNLTKGTFSN